jgi:uracil-DNA glycosylase
MPVWSEQILAFLHELSIPVKLPRHVQVMNPYRDPAAWTCCEAFYQKYYHDKQPRTMIVGINPGRFGSGITGIPFTDPIRLKEICGIDNPFPQKGELSSEFMYRMMAETGGIATFYKRFYISAVCPLGFTQNGKNLNYYDSAVLEKRLIPLMHDWLQQQIDMGVTTDQIFCVGEAENFRALQRLNETGKYFKEIVPLPHPRFIMQYRRKRVDEYVDLYLDRLNR